MCTVYCKYLVVIIFTDRLVGKMSEICEKHPPKFPG